MPGHIDFENRAKRKELMKQFRAEAAGRNIAGYQQYAEDMEALDTLMDEYCEYDELGLPRTLTAEMKEKLIGAFNKVAVSGEAYLANVKKAAETDKNIQPDKGVPGMVGKLQSMLSKDLETINDHDPQTKDTSLPELLENSRTRTIDVDQKRLTKLGATMSSRLAINVVNSKNVRRPGIFTKETKVSFMDRYNNAISSAKSESRNRAEADALDSILPKYKALLIKSNPKLKDQPDEYFANSLIRYSCGEKDPMSCGQSFNPKNFDKIKNALGIPKGALSTSVTRKLGAEFSKLNDGIDHVYITFTGLNDGDRIDAANAGMSAVAGILGKSSLLAKSFAMDLRDENGDITKGTFMEYSPGLTLNEKSRNDYMGLSDEPFKGTEGLVIKQLSDVQVIDYLCGNVDRHFGNLTYLTNEQGKIIGVQGIDNDCSFGRIAGLGKRHKELPGVDNMNCISKSMADKIKAMDPAMLKFSLRGRGLNEEQIEFSAMRLMDLKKAIKKGEKHYEGRGPVGADEKPFDKGYLRVVPDEEFAALKMERMYTHGKTDQYNLFSEVNTYVNLGLKYAREAGLKYDPEYKKTGLHTGVGTTSEMKYNADNLSRPLEGADKLIEDGAFKIDDLTKGSRTSEQFDKMTEATKYVAKLQKHLKKLSDDGADMTSVEYRKYVKLLDESINDLDEKTDRYLNRKIGQRGAHGLRDLRGKNEYEQKRIDHAKSTHAFVKDAKDKFKSHFQVPKDLEMDEVEKADYRSATEQQEIDDRRSAMKALEELHRNRGMKSPREIKKAQKEGDKVTLDKYNTDLEKARNEIVNAPNVGSLM